MHDRMIALFCGLGGGVAGVIAMNKFMKRTASAVKERSRDHEPQHQDISLRGPQRREDESATAAVGRKAYDAVVGREPSEETKRKLSSAVHWGYGLTTAGAYAMLRGRRRGLDIFGGALFGAGLWAFGDELAVPLLGLAEGPRAQPTAVHAQALAGHLAFGVTVAVASQTLIRVFVKSPRRVQRQLARAQRQLALPRRTPPQRYLPRNARSSRHSSRTWSSTM